MPKEPPMGPFPQKVSVEMRQILENPELGPKVTSDEADFEVKLNSLRKAAAEGDTSAVLELRKLHEQQPPTWAQTTKPPE